MIRELRIAGLMTRLHTGPGDMAMQSHVSGEAGDADCCDGDTDGPGILPDASGAVPCQWGEAHARP